MVAMWTGFLSSGMVAMRTGFLSSDMATVWSGFFSSDMATARFPSEKKRLCGWGAEMAGGESCSVSLLASEYLYCNTQLKYFSIFFFSHIALCITI